MDSTKSAYNKKATKNTTSIDKAMDDTTSTSICNSGLWKWYGTFPTNKVLI